MEMHALASSKNSEKRQSSEREHSGFGLTVTRSVFCANEESAAHDVGGVVAWASGPDGAGGARGGAPRTVTVNGKKKKKSTRWSSLSILENGIVITRQLPGNYSALGGKRGTGFIRVLGFSCHEHQHFWIIQVEFAQFL